MSTIDIYLKPFLPRDLRKAYKDFTLDQFIFDPSLIYNYGDPSFGIQSEPKMVLEYGIEKTYLGHYAIAMNENFYRRRLNFGDVKTAVAKNTGTNTVVYEVVYVEIIDELAGNPTVLNGYYPASIDNMRQRLSLTTTTNTTTTVTLDSYQQPLYMRTAQDGSYQPPNYIPVVPICYTLPGKSFIIANRIRRSGFDFKKLNFEIDRLFIPSSLDHANEQYLVFPRSHI